MDLEIEITPEGQAQVLSLTPLHGVPSIQTCSGVLP